MNFLKISRAKLPLIWKRTPFFCFSSSKFQFFSVDEHKGVHINVSELPSSSNEFTSMLSNSLIEWQSNNISGVWLKLPRSKFSLLEPALAQKFDLHHCTSEYLMLTRWLRTDVENKIPFYSTHYIGCGGIVVNEKNEMLLVRENVPTRKGWGIPGGQVNRNELIEEAAKRETFEETGVRTEFLEVIGIRELSNFTFQTAEIYFLSLLKAKSSEFNIDKNEILEAKWMGKDEVKKIIENKNAWAPTILDSIRIGYKRVFEGKIDEILLDTFNKIEGERVYIYRSAKKYKE